MNKLLAVQLTDTAKTVNNHTIHLLVSIHMLTLLSEDGKQIKPNILQENQLRHNLF